MIKLLHLLVLGPVARQLEHRLRAGFFRHIAQEQAVMLAISDIGRERPSGAPAQFKVQSEIANDLLGKEADEIRVAREARVVIRKNLLRSRRAADVVVFLQQQYAQARTRQVTRGDEPVMAGAEDDNVVFGFHQDCRRIPALQKSDGVTTSLGLSTANQTGQSSRLRFGHSLEISS